MSELVLVAIPNGVSADETATVRVLVVPRLAEGNISDYGLADWPDVLNGDARFSIVAKAGDGRTVERPATLVSSARPDVWHEFFAAGGGTIGPWRAGDANDTNVSESYRTSRRVLSTYRNLVARCAVPLANTATVTSEELRPWAGSGGAPAVGPVGPVKQRVPDFHRTVSMLRHHPRVLNALGLIFDLRIDSRILVLGGATRRALSIRCTDPPFLAALVTSPWTRYDLGGGRFVPESAGSVLGVHRGMLNLNGVELIRPLPTDNPADTEQAPDPPWALTTFDIDGAAAALRQAALSDNRGTAPGIRTIGVGLLRPGRGSDLAALVTRAATRDEDLTSTELDADDLILGYRLDVKNEDGIWLSVSDREATHTVGRVMIGDEWEREEGQFSALAAAKVGNALHADELVLRWDGWSTVVPVINFVDESVDSREGAPPGLPYDFRWCHRVRRGSLPRLRFSRRYQIRVRVADLAGGGLPADRITDTSAVASRNFHYLRYEPVPPPRIVADGRLSVGAAVDRLVVRSDGLTPEQLRDERSMLAPQAPLQLVEQHGYLDPPRSDDETWRWVQRVIGPEEPTHPRPGLPDPAANGVSAVIPIEAGGTGHELSDSRRWVGDWPDPAAKKIVLIPDTRPDADPVVMDFQPDTLTITLATAEQATVQLSSTIKSGLQSHLAMYDVLAGTGQPLSHTTSGRNPIVTPVHNVLVVHAVRKPLSPPKWTLPSERIIRNAGDTSVLLKPIFAPARPGAPGLNTDSTGRLDVAATWTDIVDEGEQAAVVPKENNYPHLFSATIDRGDPPNLEIRHEFGDTRHRTVKYTLDAITRFRRYFEANEQNDLFHISLPQDPVTVLSSARPGPLTVLGVMPSFAWQPIQLGTNRIEHERRAQRIRVELARPWYLTGDGECLGVVLRASGSATPVDRYVSRMGRDPLFGTPATPRYPVADWFVGASGRTETLPLPEVNDVSVAVVPHRVVAAGDRWVADIVIAPLPNQRSYNSFVELALVRYQPSSIRGRHISTVTIADKVPLLPDRRVVVERSGNLVRVTVTGLGPTQGNRVEAVLERAPGGGIMTDLVSTGPAANAAAAWSAGPRASGQLGSALLLELPATSNPLRLRITESEAIAAAPNPSPVDELARRTVFVDVIALPDGWRA